MTEQVNQFPPLLTLLVGFWLLLYAVVTVLLPVFVCWTWGNSRAIRRLLERAEARDFAREQQAQRDRSARAAGHRAVTKGGR